MTGKEFWEGLKYAASILEAALPLLEKQFQFLPVTPAVRNELLLVSMFLAGLFGFGSYRWTKISPKVRTSLWLWGLALCTLLVLFQIGIGHGLDLPPTALPGLVRASYFLFFVALGIAVGGLLGLLP
jgi:hypothetical protein